MREAAAGHTMSWDVCLIDRSKLELDINKTFFPRLSDIGLQNSSQPPVYIHKAQIIAMQQNTTIIIILISVIVLCFLVVFAFRQQYLWEAARTQAKAETKHHPAVLNSTSTTPKGEAAV